jgi:hypothetical protein
MIRLQIFIILLALGLQSFARDTVIKKITDDVITVTPGKKQLQSLGWPNDMINSVAIKTTEGIVLINTQNSPANAHLIKNAVSEYFNDTVFTYIINNHGLSGHTGGNCVFTESHIIAHTNSTTEIRDYDELFLGQTVDFFRKKIAYNHNVLDTITVEGKMQDSLNTAVDLYKYYENDLINNFKVRFADITFDHKYELTVGNKDFLLPHPIFKTRNIIAQKTFIVSNFFKFFFLLKNQFHAFVEKQEFFVGFSNVEYCNYVFHN